MCTRIKETLSCWKHDPCVEPRHTSHWSCFNIHDLVIDTVPYWQGRFQSLAIHSLELRYLRVPPYFASDTHVLQTVSLVSSGGRKFFLQKLLRGLPYHYNWKILSNNQPSPKLNRNVGTQQRLRQDARLLSNLLSRESEPNNQANCSNYRSEQQQLR